ncbi:hypothetical protein CO151_01590 [bacterium CG_4_9_14_3_um_filter_65_15]|nr:MAG: hypothetical protein CO151_01590 [bacterium CG_4_9_14_3_um_filter_65_15]
MPIIRARRLGIPAGLLSAAVVLFIMFSAWPDAASAGSPPEIGASADPAESPPLAIGPVRAEIQLGAGWMSLLEDDMDGTYGGLPLLEARIAFPVGPRDQLFLGLGYGWTDGDPYFDRVAFSDDRSARLRLVPVRAGYLHEFPIRESWSLNAGVLLEMVWSRETLPSYLAEFPDDPVTVSGWNNGIGAVIGSQWRFDGGTRAVGLEIDLTGNSGPNSSDGESRDLNLSGLLMRFCGSLHIGGGGS